MRVDENGYPVLSERNLLTLLAGLYANATDASIHRGAVCVRAEPDRFHYEGRTPGPMSHEMEEIITALQGAYRQAAGK